MVFAYVFPTRDEWSTSLRCTRFVALLWLSVNRIEFCKIQKQHLFSSVQLLSYRNFMTCILCKGAECSIMTFPCTFSLSLTHTHAPFWAHQPQLSIKANLNMPVLLRNFMCNMQWSCCVICRQWESFYGFSFLSFSFIHSKMDLR